MWNKYAMMDHQINVVSTVFTLLLKETLKYFEQLCRRQQEDKTAKPHLWFYYSSAWQNQLISSDFAKWTSFESVNSIFDKKKFW